MFSGLFFLQSYIEFVCIIGYDMYFLLGFVGETDKNNENKHYLFTHKNILVQYNGNQVFSIPQLKASYDKLYVSVLVMFFPTQIIHVNLTQESPKLLEAGKKVDLTYSVKWTSTDVTFAHRFDVYLDYPFFEHQVLPYSFFFLPFLPPFPPHLLSIKISKLYSTTNEKR